MHGLIAAQNNTIAVLAARLDDVTTATAPSAPAARASCDSHRIASLKAQMKATATKVSKLATTLVERVQESVNLRMDRFFENFIENKIKSLKPDVDFVGLLEDQSAATKSLLLDYNEVVKSRCAEVSAAARAEIGAAFDRLKPLFDALVLKSEFETVAANSHKHNLISQCAERKPDRGVEVPWETDTSSLSVSGGACADSLDTPNCFREEIVAGPLDHISTWPFARLTGVKTLSLNDKAGSVLSYDDASSRCGFLIHSAPIPKAIKPENLVPYLFANDDVSSECGALFNLNAFPPCGCDLTT